MRAVAACSERALVVSPEMLSALLSAPAHEIFQVVKMVDGRLIPDSKGGQRIQIFQREIRDGGGGGAASSSSSSSSSGGMISSALTCVEYELRAAARLCSGNPRVNTKQGVFIINKEPNDEERADQEGHCDDDAAKEGEPAPVLLLSLCYEGFWILVNLF